MQVPNEVLSLVREKIFRLGKDEEYYRQRLNMACDEIGKIMKQDGPLDKLEVLHLERENEIASIVREKIDEVHQVGAILESFLQEHEGGEYGEPAGAAV